ncbi:putative Heavy metal transport/detoxification superfamily protein [Melia azedarach]|uniref:Heavy metal transport/detoxification superfamily protein n=1 Tax=Melia azedarach TaxID=155640 RepID=A0ACC1Z4J2_MELAZ|nr:putative Heavy metal transport/detoxification superfamily protein [Melia azedarach]
MCGQKSRSKALKIAAWCFSGDDKSQIEVTGDGVDAVALTTMLRKKVGYAELVSVGAAGGGGDEKKAEENESNLPVCPYYAGVPHSHCAVRVVRDYDPCSCSIL